MNRLMSFIGLHDGGEQTVKETTSQTYQAILAFGNGGLLGLGPGQSRQSHLFLPESYGDFIYSIIGEELGFLGSILILAAFTLIFWRGIIISKKAPDDFGYYLSSGIIITLAIYVIINSGVNTGLLPTTGLPMPFLSYGGTAVLFYASAIGILLNISAQAGTYPKDN
jgi:cell division protein FtsW